VIDVKVYIIAGKEFKVRIGDTEVKRTDVIPQKFKHFYIGGIPNVLRERSVSSCLPFNLL